MSTQECNCGELWRGRVSDLDLQCRLASWHHTLRSGNTPVGDDGSITHWQLARQQRPFLENMGIPSDLLDTLMVNHGVSREE